MKKISLILTVLLTQVACSQDNNKNINTHDYGNDIINDEHKTDFILLPENQVAERAGVKAFYAKPTNRYSHGILGDGIEASQLVVNIDGKNYQHTLVDTQVFEDIRPRLFDVDNDGRLEVITIRTDVNRGAGIAIYKLDNEKLVEFAHVPTIGLSHRWLNIAGINDFDDDGVVELAWVQTPHIGGILKVAHIKAGTIRPFAEAKLYSNHQMGKRNLCLSAVVNNIAVNNVAVNNKGQKNLYLPTQQRNAIVGFSINNDTLQIVDTITPSQPIDFSIALHKQHTFEHLIEDSSCITHP